MKQIRLLPVVIAAALALFALKGFGIMSGGGYVLTGPTEVQAAGGGGGHGAPADDHGGGGEATMTMPAEPTMTDTSPMLDDGAPTLGMPGAGGHGDTGHGGSEESDHGDGGHAEADAGGHGEPADAGHGAADDHGATASADNCPPQGTAEDTGHGEDAGHGSDEIEGFDFVGAREACAVDPGVNAQGDALPLIKDGAGNIVPLANADGSTPSENALLERLSERRQVLEPLETELDLRLALVEAAEKRIDERSAALEVLEARIEAMVDEKRALEETQFVAVVAMYETMKPKDAAAILDELDMSVLLRVARAINPRKMAPIMAKMAPTKAMELTAGLAVDQVEPTIDMSGGENLAALPQIIGQ